MTAPASQLRHPVFHCQVTELEVMSAPDENPFLLTVENLVVFGIVRNLAVIRMTRDVVSHRY